MIKLTRLCNADGEIVGWFNDHGAEMAARREWNRFELNAVLARAPRETDDVLKAHQIGDAQDWVLAMRPLKSEEVAIVAADLENVEPSDDDRMDYLQIGPHSDDESLLYRLQKWNGAASVEVQRFLINKYRRPGKSNRDADLGGPVDAAGVLYVLKIKAPR